MGYFRGSGAARTPVLAVALASVLSVLSAGCGSDESDRSNAEQCQDFVNAYCDKEVECDEPTDRTREADFCEFNYQVLLDCSKVYVARSMADCLDAMDRVSCATFTAPDWFDVPPQCRGVLETQ